uniref:Leucine rich repeats-containing protein n=1 Tax=Trepomonas sp. PC1 TaxID=1076344 RepID=A0A146KD29_9EUKA|eukprot:JAP94407.1 Leucine rich repeats-containing protein [Trepomonas sp. PC1]
MRQLAVRSLTCPQIQWRFQSPKPCVSFQQMRILVLETKTEVPKGCFYKANLLLQISCKEVKAIKESVFECCYSLMIVRSKQLQLIEQQGFGSCLALSQINLENITQLHQEAFYNCNSLVQIEMNKLKSIPKKLLQVLPSASTGCCTKFSQYRAKSI